MNDEVAIDIAALAKLARVEIAPEEQAKLQKEIPNILEFVRVIQNVDVSNAPQNQDLRNVMRADENPHETGSFTKTLLDAAPAKDKDRIVVKQVISRKK